MSGRELLAQRFDGGLIAVMLQDGQLEDVAVDRDDVPKTGAIHLGRVARLAPNLSAAFVDLDKGESGLLRAGDLRPRPPADQGIASVLWPGEPILVQVRTVKPTGKAAGVSMDVSLPGRFLVHLPLGRGTNVSRRVTDPAERMRLAGLPGSIAGGWIVRAKAASLSDEEIGAEAARLAAEWSRLSAQVPDASAPTRIGDGPNAALRLLIDAAELPARIEISDDDVRREVEAWGAVHDPRFGARLVSNPEADPLSLRDIDERLAELLRPAVALPGGGGLMIEPTTALTAIDVDSGPRSTPLQANLEAATEIGRQIRLRHVGGIVVIDFITMRREQDRKKVLAVLSQAVSQDPAPTQLYGMSALGLVELVRERRGLPLSDLLNPQALNSRDER